MRNASTEQGKTGGMVVGLDIGGSKIMAAAAYPDGAIVHRLLKATPERLLPGLELLKRMVRELTGDAKCLAIGAAIGGPLNWQQGIVSPLHQPQWRKVPLKEIMEDAFGCPFYVDVDTNVAALGEYHFGKETASRLVYLTISTGMGGGFLIDGKIYRGAGGSHPEVGHQSIPFRCTHPERVICECGATDCLEALVSGNGIRRIYRKPAEQLTEAEWQEVGYNLGQGLRNISVMYAPEVIVLGGGVSVGAGERLLMPARRVLQNTVHLVPIPEVRLSRLGYDTALRGAISLALLGNDNI